MVVKARMIDGEKFMWDGRAYSSSEDAKSAADAYRMSGFSAAVMQAEDQHLVYTRRLVREAVAIAQPPATSLNGR